MAVRFGLVPTPLFETHIATTLARTVMAATKLGIFEAIDRGYEDSTRIARACNTDPSATSLLLNALTANRYLSVKAGRYRLGSKSRRWLLRRSSQSIRDKILLQYSEWQWLTELEMFITNGRPLHFHSTMSADERRLYHCSMRALAGIAGKEVARRMPTPPNPTSMLDIGGSHGHYSAELCRRFPKLAAEVLDLPEAIEEAAPILAAEGLGDRVIHRVGSVLTTDLGTGRYDLIFMSNVAHHLDAHTNGEVAKKVERALKPGGVFVIQEPVLNEDNKSQTGALLALYFGLQSENGVRTWSVAEMATWQSQAGLRTCKPIKLRTAPGWVQQPALRVREV